MVKATKSENTSGKTKDIKAVQLEIQSLQKALTDLVDALITEGKPGPKEIKKLQAFKKRAQNMKNNLPKEKKPKAGIKVRQMAEKRKKY
jgi:hypothetical protein